MTEKNEKNDWLTAIIRPDFGTRDKVVFTLMMTSFALDGMSFVAPDCTSERMAPSIKWTHQIHQFTSFSGQNQKTRVAVQHKWLVETRYLYKKSNENARNDDLDQNLSFIYE